jgi:hypothetical protein
MIDRSSTSADTVPDPSARTILDDLVRGKGLQHYAYFFVSGEGTFWPDGTEESSGNVIDRTGRVFFFWTTWDYDRGEPAFRIWEEEQSEERWLRSGEYRRARKAVGLE